jgi:tetratricopeptide (TPR) repeat protein
MSEKEDLSELENMFMNAMKLRQNGEVDSSEKLLHTIIVKEPRLPEPHIELAHIYTIAEKYDEAITHINDAITYLENGGQWLEFEDINLIAMAYLIKGEIYKSLADQDHIVFGDPNIFEEYIKLSKDAYKKSYELDPSNEDAIYWTSEHHWVIKE